MSFARSYSRSKNLKNIWIFARLIVTLQFNMAGIYIHIPFCASRCIYCAFYSTTSLDLRQRYVDAVCRELALRGKWREVRGKRYDSTMINTIYLGGGTPSQLTIPQLHQIFDAINIYNRYSLTSHLSPLKLPSR